MQVKKTLYWCLYIMAVIFSACKNDQQQRMFTKLDAPQSGLHFRNDIRDNDSSVSFINEFGYMGGGVGIGDFNNDGLKDIFFTGNQVSSGLYINEGGNKFRDITKSAGLTTTAWCTGVSIVDINNDGYDDIYVCVLGKDLQQKAGNLLFINQKNLSFRETAAEYGLADSGYSTQAAFLDYDRDGDLDMYLVNYLLSARNSNTIFPRDRSGFSPANDRLYRNDGDSAGKGHPVFLDVSLQAGIKEDGYGLGVSVSDFNNDGWPDIYIGNDFISNDVLWLNNKNGTFTNEISRATKHQSYSSMGVDAADLNNDALPDIVTLDMLPEDNFRRKTSVSFMNYERYEAERAMGYEPEFVRNTLQLNNGTRKWHDTVVPFFSEIGQLSGIDATDWSWSVLLADFNNDGWKDIHITNGIGRDFINGDFLEFSSGVFNSVMSREEKEKAIRNKLAAQDYVRLPNYLYINNRDLSFSDQSESGGINMPSMSNGAAYADIDNDGDLDLIVNNINSDAFLFVNNTNKAGQANTAHFLKVQLINNDGQNRNGFGSKVFLFSNGEAQLQEQNPARGYFSSVDQQLIFGLGRNEKVDSLLVIWPGQKRQLIKNIDADTSLVLTSADAETQAPPASIMPQLFSEITPATGIMFRHVENSFNDFAMQRLLPQKYSQLGPFITIGDINGDGLSDFFAGNGFNFSGKIFSQHANGQFSGKNLTDSIKMEEDMDCLFFDADGDGDQDLLVTGGDVRYEMSSPFYKPRLYINEGSAGFRLRAAAISDTVKTIAGTVSAGDFDGDGDLDLFIGGRVSKWYPDPARSFILENEAGVFKDVTTKVCSDLKQPGMVTSSTWADFDGDGQMDLIVAGEWIPIRFFKNNKGLLKEVTTSTGLTQMNGMWRSMVVDDIDKDGDLDIVAGNLGLNCMYRVSAAEPMHVFSTDMDGNGIVDPVMFYYIKGPDGVKKSFPAISRLLFAEQVPSIKKKFLLYKDYANAGYDEIFKGKPKEAIRELFCDETRTCFFENTGGGKFVKHPLPIEAQFAPVNAIICDDFDRDGFKDLVIAGNEYQADVITGRYDASYGLFLKGSRDKTFIPVPPVKSGFILDGDVKDMSLITLKNGRRLLLAAVNNDSLRVFGIGK